MLLSQDAAAGSQILKVEVQACDLEVGMLLSVGEGNTLEVPIGLCGQNQNLIRQPLTPTRTPNPDP